MPVGLSLLDWIEKHLQSQGLLPLDVSEVQRAIDFPGGQFSLRWTSEETLGRAIEVRLAQKLAYKQENRPMMHWMVLRDGDTETALSGQVLLSSTIRPVALSEIVGKAVESVIVGHQKANKSPSTPPAELSLPEDDELVMDPIIESPILDEGLSEDLLEKKTTEASAIPAVDEMESTEEPED